MNLAAISEKIEEPEPSEDAGAECETIEIMASGRFLKKSYSGKDGGYIVVIATPITTMRVVDVDRDGPPPKKAVGVAATPRGRHFYFEPGEAAQVPGADQLYENLCQERGYYAERLFNKDGTPRPLPVLIGDHPSPIVMQHQDDFANLQNRAVQLGLNNPIPRE